jgi:hypothetical protein
MVGDITISPKLTAVLLGEWPVYSYKLHHTHIRFMNRYRMIEQHNATDYRLTAFGEQVRSALAA